MTDEEIIKELEAQNYDAEKQLEYGQWKIDEFRSKITRNKRIIEVLKANMKRV